MPVRPVPRRRSRVGLVLLLGTMLMMGGGGVLAALFATGLLVWPVSQPPLVRELPKPRLVAIPAAARKIPAYQMVALEDLVDPATGQINWLQLPPDRVPEQAVRSPMEVIGRVMLQDKTAGFAFRESEFLPRGTRPGMVGGIPPGKRALTLAAEGISGVHNLRAGDRFDLMATARTDDKRSRTRGISRVITPADVTSESAGHADVRVLVHFGVVVQPVTLRSEPTTSQSLTQGARTRAKPVQEIVLAVDPEEVAAVSEAIALGMRIMAVARSGRPDDPGATSITPGPPPPPKGHVTEFVSGSERELLVFPEPILPEVKGKTVLFPPPPALPSDENPRVAGIAEEKTSATVLTIP